MAVDICVISSGDSVVPADMAAADEPSSVAGLASGAGSTNGCSSRTFSRMNFGDPVLPPRPKWN